MSKEYWFTKEGDKIRVDLLEDSHILDILKYFDGNFVSSIKLERALEYVIEEAKKRGIKQKCEYIDYETTMECMVFGDYWEFWK